MFSTRFQYFFVLTKYINTLILSINGPFPSIIREHRSHNTNWSKVHLPSQYLISGDLTFRRKQNYYCFVKLPSDQALFLRAYICLNCLIKVCKLLFFGKFCFSNKGQIPWDKIINQKKSFLTWWSGDASEVWLNCFCRFANLWETLSSCAWRTIYLL